MTSPASSSSSSSWLISRSFWIDTLERAIRTAAQTAAGVISVPAVGEVAGLPLSFPWQAMLYAVALATLSSVLMSLAGRNVGVAGTASLTKAVEPAVATLTPSQPDAVAAKSYEVVQHG